MIEYMGVLDKFRKKKKEEGCCCRTKRRRDKTVLYSREASNDRGEA